MPAAVRVFSHRAHGPILRCIPSNATARERTVCSAVVERLKSLRDRENLAAPMRTLVWYRGKDLRTVDHEPLLEASQRGDVIPLFVLDPAFFEPQRARRAGHRMQFLLESLGELRDELAALGSRLLVVAGKSTEVVPHLAARWKVDAVFAQRWVEPFARERDGKVASGLEVPLRLFEGETLLAPGMLRTQAGTPYAVFTHFARAFAKVASVEGPRPAPRRLPPIPSAVACEEAPLPTVSQLGIPHNEHVLQGGQKAAWRRLNAFVGKAAERYGATRDRIDIAGTSRLSVDLKFGTLSPRSVWHAVASRPAASPVFFNELIWREFCYSTLWDRPDLLERPFRSEFADFPWQDDEGGWQAWVEGRTGYPVVDAAARQLVREGFVPNRARMIAASFLTKHLLIHYRRGEAHYLQHLTDGDWANNNAGWQWCAGCGCDAQPYFRVFNPVTQSAKFDPHGDYLRRYIPELAELDARYIHAPWAAPQDVLQRAGVRLGATYPRPIVDHKLARERFLAIAKQHLASR